MSETSEREDGSAIDGAIEHLNAYGPREYADAVRKLRIAAENAKAELDARKPSRPVTEQQDNAAARVAAYFDPGGFPGFTIDANTAWTSEQVKALLDHHRAFLRQAIEPDVREVLRQLDDAKTRNRNLILAEVDANELRKRSRSTNDLARQLADRTDELATLQRQFDDFRDVCGSHSNDRVAEQVAAEDVEAELRAEVERLTRERDDARIRLAYFDSAIAVIEADYPNFGANLRANLDEMRTLLGRRPSETERHGQETAQEAAGDDPGGSVGNDARDTLQGRENGAESVEGD